MNEYKRVLAAVDFSGYTKRILEHAKTLAHCLDAELIVVSVINQREIDATYTAVNRLQKRDFHRISVQTAIERLQAERKTDLASLKNEVDFNGVNVSFELRAGVPYKELMELIPKLKADLVVMGVKGRGELADVIVGSTALKMFRRCPVPLVTVRERA